MNIVAKFQGEIDTVASSYETLMSGELWKSYGAMMLLENTDPAFQYFAVSVKRGERSVIYEETGDQLIAWCSPKLAMPIKGMLFSGVPVRFWDAQYR